MSKMNLPNKLTLLRLCLVPVNMALLLLPDRVLKWWIVYLIGAALFGLTSLTDMLDGKIARARGLITDFGKFMDPVADKFMVIGTLSALLFRMMRPDWYGLAYRDAFVALFFAALVIIIFRELAITSLRLVLVSSSGMVVAAKMLGKIKTVSQIACIVFMLVEPVVDYLIVRAAPGFPLAGVWPLSWTFVGIMTLFTLLSGIDYLKNGLKHISTDK